MTKNVKLDDDKTYDFGLPASLAEQLRGALNSLSADLDDCTSTIPAKIKHDGPDDPDLINQAQEVIHDAIAFNVLLVSMKAKLELALKAQL